MLLFELLAGFPPFCADEPIKVYALAARAEYEAPAHLPADAAELVAALLRPRPHERLGSRWGGAIDIACHRFFRGIDWPALLRRQVA